jgi:hypothetical protein
MSRVKVEEILSELERGIRSAVRDVLSKHTPSLVGNTAPITRDLIQSIGKKTGTWTKVRDSHVDSD